MKKIIGLILVFLNIALLSEAAEEEESFYVARRAFADGFYQATESLTKKFINDFPQSKYLTDAQLLLAKAYFYEEKYKEAEEILLKLQKEDIPKSIRGEAIYWQGQIELKSKRYKNAIATFLDLLNNYRQLDVYWWSIYSLAFAYLKDSEINKAVEMFNRIIDNCPQQEIQEEAFYNLATLFYKQHEYKKLKKICSLWQKKISTSKYISYIKFYEGEIAYNAGNLDIAKGLYQDALKLAEDIDLKDSIYQSLGWIYLEKRKYTLAKKEFIKVSSQELKLYSLAVLASRQNNHLEALNYFSRFCQKFPTSHLIHKCFLGLADSFYALGRLNDAAIWYKKLLGRSKEVKDSSILTKARYGLGWCYLKRGDFSQAIEQFNRLVMSSSDQIVEISAAVNIADAYQEKGDYKKAIATYKEISDKFPNNIYSDYIQMQIGVCLLKTKDWQQASFAFRALEENYPNSHLIEGARYYLALSYFFLNKDERALKILNAFKTEFSHSTFLKDVYQLEKEIYLREKKYDAVLRLYKQMQQVFSSDNDFCQSVEVEKALLYIKINQTKMAETILLGFLKKFPASRFRPDVVFYLSSLYYAENKLDKAKRLLNQIIDNFPSSSFAARAKYNLAQILWEEGEQEEATRIMEELFEKKNNMSFAAGLSLVDILFFQKNYSKALEVCDRIINNDPKDKGFLFFRKAQIYFDISEYAAAIENYNRALKNNFDSAELRFNLGFSYERKNDTASAIKNYLAVVYLFKDSKKFIVKSYLRLGKIYETKKDYQNAIRIYEKLAALNVDESSYAQERLRYLKEELVVHN